MTKEIDNGAEGHLRRTLFPLSEDALMMASRRLKDASIGEDPLRIKAHIEEIFNRPYVGEIANNFFQHRVRELPEDGGGQNFYTLGASISIDAIGVQSELDYMPVTPILQDDLTAYKAIRKRKVGARWFEADNDILILLEKNLSDFLRNADSSYSQAAEEVEEKDRDRLSLTQNIAFLLGLCDLYFPFRYADERTQILETSD